MLRLFVFVSALALNTCGYGFSAFAQQQNEDAHLMIENPASLSPAQANAIYDALKKELRESYAGARLQILEEYQSWKRHNASPYLSATHGQRFVNNYAFGDGGSYGSVAEGQTHPVGTVLAKDTITVTSQGKQFAGAMFVMQKLAPDTSRKTGDWRYIMVIPDGTIFGDTLGDDPDQMTYCHTCHKARADQDYVFHVPDAYRLKP